MRVKRLRVRGSHGRELLWIDWFAGHAHLVLVSEELRAETDAWMTFGLAEWVGADRAHHRTTPPESPEFLLRLTEYLEEQSPFLRVHYRECDAPIAIDTRGESKSTSTAALALAASSVIYFTVSQSCTVGGAQTVADASEVQVSATRA